MLNFKSVRPTGRMLHVNAVELEKVGSIHIPARAGGQKRLCTVVAKGPLCKREDIKVGDQVILAPWEPTAQYDPFDDTQVLVHEKAIISVVEIEVSGIITPDGARDSGIVPFPSA